jgi:hypothetical protein
MRPFGNLASFGPVLPLTVWLVLGVASNATAADAPVSFAKEILPVFEKSCWNCHGASVQLSKLDLRSRDSALKGGDHGAVIVPGNAEKSKLYRLVAGLEKPAMPMDGRLTAQQVAAFKQWIDQGAAWDAAASAAAATASATPGAAAVAGAERPFPPEARNYWAFRKPVRPVVPETSNERMNRNPVDAFLMKAMEAKGLKPAPQADPRTLVRRAYLDLTGLPPTPAEAAEFVNDKSPDAWEKLIDRLLASPHYGECWGRHWLDVARYADSNGFEHDFDRPNAWRYRDYVIRAFNSDKPYNLFLREQIAGDELDWVTKDSLIATGFLRSYAKVGFREKDNPEFRYEYLDDMIATLGRGVLGLTVQCARCHDHKFDPIRQTDYYKMQASLFGYVETDFPLTSRAEAEAYSRKMAEIDARVKDLKLQVKTLEKPYRDALLPEKYKKFPQNIQDAINTPEEKRTDGQKLLAGQVIRTVNVSSDEIDKLMKPAELAEKKRLNTEIEQAEKSRPKPIPMAAGVTDGDYRFTPDGPGDEPAPGKGVKREAIEGSYLHQGPGPYQVPPSFLLIRGDVNSKGPRMQPGFVSIITAANTPTELPRRTGNTSGRRLALAEWLISPDNPLTTRVIVNRIWHHHFGRGIVSTLDNFGKMGEMPTNPELLDWLALEFQERGWSIKEMHRLIMNSEAYKMSSQFADADDLAKDPEDRYNWRFRIQRLDAEIVRDEILAVSGGINLDMGGPPVFPKVPAEILASMTNGIWKREDEGPATWRRSVYVYRKRGLPYPLFEVFDMPNQNISCGARNVSTVPTQALTLMNDDFVLRQAQLFANRVLEAAPTDHQQQVNLAYQLALSRPPDETEQKLALDFLERHQLVNLTHVLLNLNEFVYLR